MSNRYELFSTDGKYEYYKDTKTGLVGCNFVETMNMLDFQISDLEAKLVEMTKKYELASCPTGGLVDRVRNLELQLAEKDEELKQLKLDLGMFKSVNEFINRYGIEKAREVLLQTEKTKNQDKISFAVEVLKIAQDYVQQYVNNFDDMNDCLCAIDNQIKRLTHQHEDKGE